MTVSQYDKAQAFRALHAGPLFIIPNPWDRGSAQLLAGLGFQALATSSSASAGTRGRKDGQLARDEALEHARELVHATDLPVSADLENGFSDTPDSVASTIRLAAQVGLVGGSIEDCSAEPRRVYDLAHAVERVQAAAEAAHSLPIAFTLTARCENFLRGVDDLDDTIRRLQAYEKAGADVLMAPGLPDIESVRTVCAALGRPFNFMAGMKGKSFPVPLLAAAGVRRVSLAGSLYRAAMAALRDAATEVRDEGSFGYLDRI